MRLYMIIGFYLMRKKFPNNQSLNKKYLRRSNKLIPRIWNSVSY